MLTTSACAKDGPASPQSDSSQESSSVSTTASKSAETTAPSTPTPSSSVTPARFGPLDGWSVAAETPLRGLYFGMSFEEAWEAAPGLRDAMQVRLEASAYDALIPKYPVLQEFSESGNAFGDDKTHHGSWPTVAGAKWELWFEDDRGLVIIFAKFPDEASLRAGVATWGQPAIDARWDFWFDEATSTRGAFTECHDDNDDTGFYCALEFMPYQSVESFLAQVFPEGKTFVGIDRAELDLGKGEERFDGWLYYLTPLPTSLAAGLEVQLDDSSKVRSYRTIMSYGYDVEARERFARALDAASPNLQSDGACRVGSIEGQVVRVCENYSQFVITVGEWL